MKQYPHLDKEPTTEIEWFEALVRLARYLRGPDGCPWDQKQTAKDFCDCLIEETQELDEAFVEQNNDNIEEEWGDTFFNTLAILAAAEHEGRFSLAHALERIHEKLIRRHGHVFGDHTAETPEEAINVWNRIKAEEKAENRN